MSDTILRSSDSGVLTLTLNRPDALNSFNVEMKEALLAALKDAARDREVRVVVLTGAGRAFSAGQDLKEREAPGAADLGTELRTRYNPIILAMRRLEKPIIGAINGVAAGAGISVALACDIRIASEVGELHRGLRPCRARSRHGLVMVPTAPRGTGTRGRDVLHHRPGRCRHGRANRARQ